MSHAVRRASRTASAFNPVTAVGWARAFWAEGTDMAAQGYTDGAAVGTWPDEVGANDVTEATNRPAYRASVAALNNRPAIDFDATNDILTGAWTQAQTFSVVFVGTVDSLPGGGFPRIVELAGGAQSVAYLNGDGKFAMFMGTAWNSTSSAYSVGVGHMVMFKAAGASSSILVDATSTAAATTGTGGATQIKMAGSTEKGDITAAFFGFYAGDVTADGGWAGFKAWVTSHYGITT